MNLKFHQGHQNWHEIVQAQWSLLPCKVNKKSDSQIVSNEVSMLMFVYSTETCQLNSSRTNQGHEGHYFEKFAITISAKLHQSS